MDTRFVAILLAGALLFGCVTDAQLPAATATPTVIPTVTATPAPQATASPAATPAPTVEATATPQPTAAPTATPVPSVAPSSNGFAFGPVNCVPGDSRTGTCDKAAGNGFSSDAFLITRASVTFSARVAYFGENLTRVYPVVACVGSRFIGTAASENEPNTQGILDWGFDELDRGKRLDFKSGEWHTLKVYMPLMPGLTQGNCTATMHNSVDNYMDARSGSTTYVFEVKE